MHAMAGSTRETEIKLRFDSVSAARERIDGLGARQSSPRNFEDNCLFDREVDPLREQGKALRLRRSGGRALLTLKAPAPSEGRHKVRTEHQTEVGDADATATVLGELGFAPRYRYQKYRTTFELGGAHLCLDETPLGCFVEIEGAPEEIDRVAALLGFSPEDYVRESYVEMARRAAADGVLRSGELAFGPVPVEPAR
jgi:adenylate cyclase class 2